MPGLGRRTPEDWQHVQKYPLRALAEFSQAPASVEKYLTIPIEWRRFYDQGQKNACVGFSGSQLTSFFNRGRFDAWWLWDETKRRDPDPGTNPGDNNGTYLFTMFDVLRLVGHKRVVSGQSREVSKTLGISANRWAKSVDELRAAIAAGTPVVVGTNWYSRMDRPEKRPNGEFWMPGTLGSLEGGHAWLLEAASDKRQAFRMPNTWGTDYPRTWVSYELMGRLLSEEGEAGIATDR